MIEITPGPTIHETTCITNVYLTDLIRATVDQLIHVTYSLAYITGILCFIIGIWVGWMLHKRGTGKGDPRPCENDGE